MYMVPSPIRILGLDPGLRRTGWGVIEAVGSRLIFVACGTVMPPEEGTLAARLAYLYTELADKLTLMASRQVQNGDFSVGEFAATFFFLDRDPGVIAHFLPKAGQGVE